MTTDRGWYTIASFGSDPAPAQGPFRSAEEADAAVERFRARHGHLAGTWLAAGSVRILGPFKTRREAQNADISDNAPIAGHCR